MSSKFSSLIFCALVLVIGLAAAPRAAAQGSFTELSLIHNFFQQAPPQNPTAVKPGATSGAAVAQVDPYDPRARITGQPARRIPRQSPRPGAALQGLIEGADGRPIPAGIIHLRNMQSGAGWKTRTTGDGVFRMTDLPSGNYQLEIDAPQYQHFMRPKVSLKSSEILTLEIELTPATTPRPAATTTIAGPVLPGAELRGMGAPAAGIPTESAEDKAYRELLRRPVEDMDLRPDVPATVPDEKVFLPEPDRWTIGMPEWNRYDRNGEYGYVSGHWYDPFNRNKIKGDYPIFGQQTFFNFTGTSTTVMDARRLPTPSNVASARPGSREFFGHGGQFFTASTLRLSFDLFHGDTAFKPVDWRIRFTPAISLNYIRTQERGIVNVDVRKGTDRFDTHLGIQEAFVEYKLADLSPNYDFLSIRAGIQQFSSDFRGFLFATEQPGVRLFGNLKSDKIEYNAAYFNFLEKDTNSGLNSFRMRHQQVMVANVYIQDFLTKGYTTQFSYHFNKDDNSVHYDENGFLVRPSPIGTVIFLNQVKPHAIRAHYIGWTGNGHFGRYNITHAFYQALGHDTFNPLAGRRVDINARMAALELSLDRSWYRVRTSVFYASGDKNPRDGHAHGFDAIGEDQTFAGGEFSFFNREGVRLSATGVSLNSGNSFFPNLRSSKEEGQTNFVNPGLFLVNAGADFEVTPKIRAVVNANYLRFIRTEPLQLLLFQRRVHTDLGLDYGAGLIYRPPLSENITLTGGFTAFTPLQGFRDIYTSKTLLSGFGVLRFQF